MEEGKPWENPEKYPLIGPIGSSGRLLLEVVVTTGDRNGIGCGFCRFSLLPTSPDRERPGRRDDGTKVGRLGDRTHVGPANEEVRD